MNNRDSRILMKILQEIDIAADMISGVSENVFLVDEKLKRAVCMTLINIGELVKNLSSEIVSQHREVPWKEVAGLRDIAAHKYQTLRCEPWVKTMVFFWLHKFQYEIHGARGTRLLTAMKTFCLNPYG